MNQAVQPEATSLPALFSLNGRSALVTGASSGIGHHLAQTLAAAGARVFAAARRTDRLESLVQIIRAAGGQAHAVALDVSDSASVRACFDAIESSVGAPDIIISNAGTTVAKPALDQTEQDWDDVLDTNLKGVWMIDTEAARRMVKHGVHGSIVNVASILGARVAGAVIGYSASKAGVIQLTKSLARHGIRVNALLPGYVITDLNRDFLLSEAGKRLQSRVPGRRFCEMTDLDGPVLMLASDASRAMTGAEVAVDWGHLVSSL